MDKPPPQPATSPPTAVARRPGLSVRARLTLSYAGFLLVAWAGFVVVMRFVLGFLPDANLVVGSDSSFAPGRSDLLDVAYPVALVGTVAMAVVGVGGGWLLAGRMLRPLQAIAAATHAATAGTLTHRIAMPGPDDELRQLADAFDAMLSRLQRSFEEQRRFTSNASHELRTPHAVMKTMLEVGAADPDRDVDTLLARLAEVNDRSIQTLEALLRLARAEHATVSIEPCDLTAIVSSELAHLGHEIADAGLDIDLDLQPVTVHGDPAMLRTLVRNLLVNAVRHNIDASGVVRVATGIDSAQRPVLEVRNSGDVLPPELVATLVEPFVRARGRTTPGTGPTGTGLGLTIAETIAEAHGADLELRARPGGGLVARVAFSVSSASSTRPPTPGAVARSPGSRPAATRRRPPIGPPDRQGRHPGASA